MSETKRVINNKNFDTSMRSEWVAGNFDCEIIGDLTDDQDVYTLYVWPGEGYFLHMFAVAADSGDEACEKFVHHCLDKGYTAYTHDGDREDLIDVERPADDAELLIDWARHTDEFTAKEIEAVCSIDNVSDAVDYVYDKGKFEARINNLYRNIESYTHGDMDKRYKLVDAFDNVIEYVKELKQGDDYFDESWIATDADYYIRGENFEMRSDSLDEWIKLIESAA